MFDELFAQIAGRFSRVEPRRHARAMLLGLLAELPKKNCWTLAEHAGHATPDGMQHLLSRAVWDADAVRDDLRGYVVDRLGQAGGVLVVDETGDLKKGMSTAGVQRQYTGTAGRIENSQVAVYLGYASEAGHAFIDRELYLPLSWIGNPARCLTAGIPGERKFATKGELARQMVARALDSGVPAAWVTGDEVYGNSPQLRDELEERRVGYVLAVACSHRVDTGAGVLPASEVIFSLPQAAWQRLSAGAGAKGQRWYDWALVGIDPGRPGRHWMLIRRHRRTAEPAFFRCYAPGPTPLKDLVAVAGRRWAIEEGFQTGKGLTGLDQHQVRRWTSWYRWTVPAMPAHAFLAALTAAERNGRPATGDLIPLTLAEIQRLFTRLTSAIPRSTAEILRWSQWRRRHQARARTSHYQRHTKHPT
jgi:SRSO17 transposase